MSQENTRSHVAAQMRDPLFMVHQLSEMGEGTLKQALANGFRMNLMGAGDNGAPLRIEHSAESLQKAHDVIRLAQGAAPEGLSLSDAGDVQAQTTQGERHTASQSL